MEQEVISIERINERLVLEINALNNTLAKINEKMSVNFCHEFEWNADTLYKCHYMLNKYKSIDAYLKKDEKTIEKTIEFFQYQFNQTLRESLSPSSTSTCKNQNFANVARLETNREFIEFLRKCLVFLGETPTFNLR